MIDLSQFLNKKVRVTFENGGKDTGNIIKNYNKFSSYPFIFKGNDYNSGYLRNGRYDLNYVMHSKNIIHIEEIKPMNKYEELEKQVAEMQKEIDRLKKEDKEQPKITIETAKVGDVLEDGCIVVDKQGSMALLAAPPTTEVVCKWSKEFSEVFDALKSQGFNPSQWFIPTEEQLKLAYKNCKQHFASCFYWSSTEVSSRSGCNLFFNCGNINGNTKSTSICVRAFRVVNF